MSVIHFSHGITRYDNSPTNYTAQDFDEFTRKVLAKRYKEKHLGWIASACGEAPADKYHHSTFVSGLGRRKDNVPILGHPHRCIRCVQPSNWIRHDLDGDFKQSDWQHILELMKPYKGFAYTTHSHTPEDARGRIVLLLDEELGFDDFKRASQASRARIHKWLKRDGFNTPKWDTGGDGPHRPLYLPPLNTSTAVFDGAALSAKGLLEESEHSHSVLGESAIGEQRFNNRLRLPPEGDERGKLFEAFKFTLQWAQGRGYLKESGARPNGHIEMTCPWVDEHSPDERGIPKDDGCCMMLPGDGNNWTGGFSCCHESHSDGDTKKWYGDVLDLAIKDAQKVNVEANVEQFEQLLQEIDNEQ